jgi:hypothetical protein
VQQVQQLRGQVRLPLHDTLCTFGNVTLYIPNVYNGINTSSKNTPHINQ